MANRRAFILTTAAAGVGLGLGGVPGDGGLRSPMPRAPRALRILMLGGTGFLGPAEVEYALARGTP